MSVSPFRWAHVFSRCGFYSVRLTEVPVFPSPLAVFDLTGEATGPDSAPATGQLLSPDLKAKNRIRTLPRHSRVLLTIFLQKKPSPDPVSRRTAQLQLLLYHFLYWNLHIVALPRNELSREATPPFRERMATPRQAKYDPLSPRTPQMDKIIAQQHLTLRSGCSDSRNMGDRISTRSQRRRWNRVLEIVASEM